MKKNNLFMLCAMAIASVTLLMACDKDDHPVPEKLRKLMAADWKITAISTKKINEPAVDSNLLKPCTTDDLIKFTNTGFDFQDGATKCDSTVFFYAKGNWGLNETTDSIHLGATTPAKYMSWKITTLNDSVLKVTYTDSTNPAKKIKKDISFKH